MLNKFYSPQESKTNGELFITIQHLFSLNQFFDFFVLIVYLKNLVKVMPSYINSTQGIKGRTVARISEVKERTNKYSYFSNFLQLYATCVLPLPGIYLQLASQPNCWKKLFFFLPVVFVCASSKSIAFKTQHLAT